MQSLTGIGALADAYDGFVLDAWGTLHEGGDVLPAALDAVRRLHAAGKRLAVVSNTPQLGPVLARRLAAQGLPVDCYDLTFTAGDLAHEDLATASGPWFEGLGRRAYHLAPDRFPDLLPGTPFTRVDRIEDADLLVNGGPDRDDLPVAAFAPLFRTAVARGIPMICANPDRAIVDRGVRKICAGELAAAYEALGGHVRYHGKPYPALFRRAVEELGSPAERTLVVGDGLATDIAGAAAAGLDSLLIAGGLHAEALLTDGGTLVEHFGAAIRSLSPGARPRFAMPKLEW
ncbi:TIGR01459 family HAD-type hydrolase [Thalassobaculum sp.]|uniref:TIGR01459 family HAD-type hydrolase n=1 Tax=Thalassobaculum sp. TaxID=2022740 RepID=UPI0032ED47D3